MSAGATVLLVLLSLSVGLVVGMVWGTWDMRSEPGAQDHDTHQLERRVRLGLGRSWEEHPAVTTKALPYDRTREDQPI